MSIRWLGALSLSLCAACGGSDANLTASPELVLLDSIRLAETDSVYIGQANHLVAATDGTFLIADVRTSALHHYAPEGTYLRTIGRRGTGPGEFAAEPVAVALDGDSLLVVLDGMSELRVFEYRSGVYRGTRMIPLAFIHSLAMKDAQVFFRLIDRNNKASVGALNVRTESLSLGGPFPRPLGESQVIDQMAFSQIAPLKADTIAVAMLPWDRIFVGRFQGDVYDSIPVAVLKRQGSRPDLFEQFARDPRNAGPEVYTPSLPAALTRLSNGHYAYVTADLQLIESRFTGTLFLSVVDPVTRRTCPDAQIVAPTDPRAWATFRADTLIVLAQHIAGTGSATWIRKYGIHTKKCAWRAG